MLVSSRWSGVYRAWRRIRDLAGGAEIGILTIEDALHLRKGKRIAFTNGVFDILHAGHVEYLGQAREGADLLIVGLNSDDSVRRLNKGVERPLNTWADRATVVAALRSVDAVIAFDEDTPVRLIEILRPEIHVKGGDYLEEDLPEAQVVRSYGGEVRIVPLLEGRSTTGILAKLRALTGNL